MEALQKWKLYFEDILEDVYQRRTKMNRMSNKYCQELKHIKALSANEQREYIRGALNHINAEDKLKELKSFYLEQEEQIKQDRSKIAITIETLKDKEDLLNRRLQESILTAKEAQDE